MLFLIGAMSANVDPYPIRDFMTEFDQVCAPAKNFDQLELRAADSGWTPSESDDFSLAEDVLTPIETLPRNVEGKLAVVPPFVSDFRDGTTYFSKKVWGEALILAITKFSFSQEMPELIYCSVFDEADNRPWSKVPFETYLKKPATMESSEQGVSVAAWVYKREGKREFPQVFQITYVEETSKKAEFTGFYGYAFTQTFGTIE